ncbi:MAG: rhomboid family intramembrane serine protease [Lysobacteraceae bacterium]
MDIPLQPPVADPQSQRRHDRHRFLRALLISLGFIGAIWWIKMIELWLGTSFSWLGVRPDHWTGLIGIVSAPMLHGSVEHLLSNTLPLLVLGTLTFAVYPRSAWRALATVWLLSGLGIWLFGRPSTHIGASGLTHGLMFFLFVLGLLRRDRPAVATAMIAFFLYGGMLLSVLPGDPKVSWEAHLFGALSGVLAALLWGRLDPAPPRKRYSWEDEDDISPLEDELAARQRAELEPARPNEVPVLWQHPPQPGARVIDFPAPPRSERDS